MNFSDCAVLVVDDPNGYAPRIAAGASVNMLVRTRADENYYPGTLHKECDLISLKEENFSLLTKFPSNILQSPI